MKLNFAPIVISETASVPVPGDAVAIVKSTVLLFVSPEILVIDVVVVGDGAGQGPSN